MEVCFCQEGSSLESVYGKGGCRGKAANSPYCRTREAVAPVVIPAFEGFKYCGRRAGSNFLTVKRPYKDQNGAYKCPIGTSPCGGQTVLDENKQEHVLCTTSESLCPITAVSLALDSSNNFALSVSKEPNSLPISHFKFSTGTPCIKESEEPSTTKGSFLDEYTRSSTLGCTEDDFKKKSEGSDEKASIDTNDQRVGTFTVN